MTKPSAGDAVSVTMLVAVERPFAFEVFTQEIDQWWRRGLKYRIGHNRSMVHLEGHVGGALYEAFETPSGSTKTLRTGTVLVWDPPARLLLEWRAVNFAPDEKTEVEVCFEESPSGTLVTITHRGWGAIREDHPARHGEAPLLFLRTLGQWWASLATSLRIHCDERLSEHTER